MDAKTKEDGLIKSLLSSGFTEEYLDDMIAKGAIKVGGDMESEDENPEDETEEKKEEKEEGKKKRKGKEKESEAIVTGKQQKEIGRAHV